LARRIFKPCHATFEIERPAAAAPRHDCLGDVARLERRGDAIRHGADRCRERDDDGSGIAVRREVAHNGAAPRRRQEAHEAIAQQAGIAAVERVLDQFAGQRLAGPASSASAASVALLRAPRGRPAGLPDWPFRNWLRLRMGSGDMVDMRASGIVSLSNYISEMEFVLRKIGHNW
jgi:hypothetical protein